MRSRDVQPMLHFPCQASSGETQQFNSRAAMGLFVCRTAALATPEDPLCENELRGLSACRFLQRFFRSPAVLDLATGEGATSSIDSTVRGCPVVKTAWTVPAAN